MIQLPKKIPIFPLRGVIFFPETNLPLNIFEERYLKMTNDILKNDKFLGMVQSKEINGEIYQVGCLGKISDYQETSDGRVLINLTGITRFEIKKEVITKKKYREFEVDYKKYHNDLILPEKINFDPVILPKKAIFQLCSLLEDYEGEVKVSNIKSKIKFELNNSILISKLIDGKFPNYVQVIPKENQKKLEVDLKSFLNSVDRVASVSLDKKDGVKFNISKDILNLSVNNTNSGDGKETLNAKFDHELDISFNSRYLIDVASQLDGDVIEIYLKDTGSPALIRDPADFDSIYVVMPMKG